MTSAASRQSGNIKNQKHQNPGISHRQKRKTSLTCLPYEAGGLLGAKLDLKGLERSLPLRRSAGAGNSDAQVRVRIADLQSAELRSQTGF